MIDIVTMHLADIAALCRQYGVHRLDLFGSAASDAFDPAASDLDFVATFADTRAPNYAERYLDFADALEALFGRPVDVVTENMIRSPYFRQAVEATRQPVYDDRDAPATDPHPNPSPCAQGEGLVVAASSFASRWWTTAEHIPLPVWACRSSALVPLQPRQ
ncbi:MAG: nucleotidyltransferase family protein [Thermomicrobiales bacterium]